jgi:hypothetical protein
MRFFWGYGIDDHHELPLLSRDGRPRHPDFAIAADETGQIVYWEHLGILRIPFHKGRWKRKLERYRAQGIVLVTRVAGLRASSSSPKMTRAVGAV